MIFTHSLTRALIAALMLTVSGVPELIAQTTQSNNDANASNSQIQGQSNSQGNTDPRFSGVKPDPSAGPQTPTLTPRVPESSSPVQPQQQLPSAPAPQPNADSNTQPAQPVTQRENP